MVSYFPSGIKGIYGPVRSRALEKRHPKRGPDLTMKLVIIRAAALGDTLMLMPAIAQLNDLAHMVLVGRSPGVDFISPSVDRCIDFEGSGWHQLFLEKWDVTPDLNFPEADLIVAFMGDPEGCVVRNLQAHMPKASVHLFPPFPPDEDNVHVAFYLAQCLRKSGLPVDPENALEEASRRPLLKVGGEAKPKPKIVFHPGSGGKGKNHPPEFWLELIGKLTSHFPSPPLSKSVILLGPAEEQLLPFFTAGLPSEGMEILFSPDNEELEALLTRAPLYIGHDSGITHLAAMLGTPTIALFRKSPVRQWRPLGPAVKVIESEESSPDLMVRILEEIMPLVSQS